MLLGGQFDHWAFIFVQEGEWQKKKWEPSPYSPYSPSSWLKNPHSRNYFVA